METNIVTLQAVNGEDDTFRIDAEHYKKEYSKVKSTLLSKKSVLLKTLLSRTIVTGHTPSMKNENYYGEDVNFIKTDNLREFTIKNNYTHKLSKEGNKIIKRSELKVNDIIITIIGASNEIVGRASLVQKKELPANINQNIALIRVNNKIDPSYLTVYLNAYHGKNYLWYLSRQTEQVNLNCREVENVLVPRFKKTFEDTISAVHNKANELNNIGLLKYSKAEEIILHDIRLENWKCKNKLSYERDFSEIHIEKRIDAEHYNPLYDEIVSIIKSYNNGWDIIHTHFKPNKKIFKKIKEHEYNYIEIGSVDINNGTLIPEKIPTEDLPANAKIKLNKNDIIISKVRSYRGAIAIVDRDDLIGSSAFTVLSENGNINKDTLFILLKTKPYLFLTTKYNTGTSYPVLVDEDIFNMPIPSIKKEIQDEISDLVVEGRNSFNAAKILNNIAKVGFEKALEDSEHEGEKWIKEEFKKIGETDGKSTV